MEKNRPPQRHHPVPSRHRRREKHGNSRQPQAPIDDESPSTRRPPADGCKAAAGLSWPIRQGNSPGRIVAADERIDDDPDSLATIDAPSLGRHGSAERRSTGPLPPTCTGAACIKAIVRTTCLSRQTMRRILRGTRDDIFRSRESSLDRWVDRLQVEWDGGCRKGAELWRRLNAAGLGGSQRVVAEWTTRRRRAVSSLAPESVGRVAVPSSRIVARVLTCERDVRSAEALRIRVAVETACPTLVAARTILDRFKAMVASAGKSGDLDPWLADAAGTEMVSFANGISADRAAVSGCHHDALVRWANRRPGHPAEAR